MIDTVIRGIADIGLTVPGLLVLIIIAVSVKGSLTVNEMALIVASLAWLNPTRHDPVAGADVARARLCGDLAALYGMGGPEIIFRELMPNLMPYLAATLVSRCRRRSLRRSGWRFWGSDRWMRRHLA